MLIIFGDSHARCFQHLKLPKTVCEINVFIGASIQGLASTDSKTGANKKILARLERAKPDDKVLFFFGHVDLDFIYWYRKHQVGNEALHIDTFIDDTIAKYKDFLAQVKQTIIIACPHLTTLNDAHFLWSVANHTPIKKPTKSDSFVNRTGYCNKFIQKLKQLPYRYIDISAETLCPNKQTIHPKHMNAQRMGKDHHPDERKIAQVWKPHILSLT